MGSTIDALKNSLGFGKQIDDLKENNTPEVDSMPATITGTATAIRFALTLY